MRSELTPEWSEVIEAPENEAIFQRYPWASREPRALFEAIGDDLASLDSEKRKIAFWALVIAIPELTDILHERESRRPGWRSGSGRDQRMVNQGVRAANDVVSYLHSLLVTKHHFKMAGDPRPYVNKAVHNWRIDAVRYNSRAVSLDAMMDQEAHNDSLLSLMLDPNVSVENEALARVALEEGERELDSWQFLEEDDKELFRLVYVDDLSSKEIAARVGVSEAVVNQRFSRARKRAVKFRDEMITGFLVVGGNLYGERASANFRRAGWKERTIESIDPAPWLFDGTPDNGAGVAIRPLTRSFSGAPGRVFLLAIRKSLLRREDAKFGFGSGEFIDYIDHNIPEPQAFSLIWGKAIVTYPVSILNNQIPAINQALRDVGDEYRCILMSEADSVVQVSTSPPLYVPVAVGRRNRQD